MSKSIIYTNIILTIIILTSCFQPEQQFDKYFYENVTGIKFPTKYKILETFDNGEFVTGTVFLIDSLILIDFIRLNGFVRWKEGFPAPLMSGSYLQSEKPNFKNRKDIYCVFKSKGKNDWLYVIDIKVNKLWAEIRYPDWSGD